MKALEGAEYIIRLAGAVGIGQSFWQGKKYMDVNVGGTAAIDEDHVSPVPIRSC